MPWVPGCHKSPMLHCSLSSCSKLHIENVFDLFEDIMIFPFKWKTNRCLGEIINLSLWRIISWFSTFPVVPFVLSVLTFIFTTFIEFGTKLGLNLKDFLYIYIYIQWGKKVFSQPPIVQVLPLKKMREACNFHHRYTSTMRDKIRKKIQKITL